MAERRNPELEASEAVLPTGDVPADAGAGSTSYDPAGKDPAEIERDIQHTRAEMSETLDALGQRFSPGYIKEQVKDSVQSTARDVGTSMLDTIKENPLPALVAGLSVGWLFMNANKRDRDGYRRDFDRDYRGYGRGYAASTYARGYAGYDAASNYEGGDDSLKDRATGAVEGAKERVQHAAHDAADYGRRATTWLERAMEDNPLTAGALALAAGAAVGLALPGTQWEDQRLGQKSDELIEKAKDVAEEKFEQVKSAAQETASEAKDKAKEVAETARQKAGEQGLVETGSGASEGGALRSRSTAGTPGPH